MISDLDALKDISGAAGDGMSPVRAGSQSLCTGKFIEALNMPEYKGFTGVADQAGYLILRLRSYPAWAVTVNGHPAPTLSERGHGLLAVPVEQGPAIVVVNWKTTSDVITGRLLSLVALALLSALYLFERELSSRGGAKSLRVAAASGP